MRRKIEQKMATAIYKRRPFRLGNTAFRHERKGKWVLYLYGNKIAVFDDEAESTTPMYVSCSGFATRTTQSRLNALGGVCIGYSRGRVFINGHMIDSTGWWDTNGMRTWEEF